MCVTWTADCQIFLVGTPCARITVLWRSPRLQRSSKGDVVPLSLQYPEVRSPGCLVSQSPPPGVSNLRPGGHMQSRMAVSVAQHKIVNLLKTLWDFFVITCHNVFNVWPKTALLLQCGPEMPKGWTPLLGSRILLSRLHHWKLLFLNYLSVRKAAPTPAITSAFQPIGRSTGE